MSIENKDLEKIFANRPIDEGTRITGERYAYYDDIPVMIENWSWDNISASSCIVPVKYLEKAKISKEEFLNILEDKLKIEGSTTTSENAGFLFLNFNFETI